MRAHELLRQEMPLVRRVEADLAEHGYVKGSAEYDTMFVHAIKFHRWFGWSIQKQGADMKENHYHFYASSVSQWATTNDKRDLRQLLKLMDKDGYSYNLFLVPCKHTDTYEIAMYQPMVKDTQWLGHYEVKEK